MRRAARRPALLLCLLTIVPAAVTSLGPSRAFAQHISPTRALEQTIATTDLQPLNGCSALRTEAAQRARLLAWRAVLKRVRQRHPKALASWLIGVVSPPVQVVRRPSRCSTACCEP